MMRLETRILIHRPVAQVFEFATRFENTPRWAPEVLESRQTSSGPMGVGTTGWESGRSPFGRFSTDWEIIEYEPNRRCVFRTSRGFGTTTVEYQFNPIAEGTELQCLDEWRLHGMLRLAEPVAARLLQKIRKGYLGNLKRPLETES